MFLVEEFSRSPFSFFIILFFPSFPVVSLFLLVFVFPPPLRFWTPPSYVFPIAPQDSYLFFSIATIFICFVGWNSSFGAWLFVLLLALVLGLPPPQPTLAYFILTLLFLLIILLSLKPVISLPKLQKASWKSCLVSLHILVCFFNARLPFPAPIYPSYSVETLALFIFRSYSSSP